MPEPPPFQCSDDFMLGRKDTQCLIWQADSFEHWVCAHCGRVIDVIQCQFGKEDLMRELRFHEDNPASLDCSCSPSERRWQDGSRTNKVGDADCGRGEA